MRLALLALFAMLPLQWFIVPLPLAGPVPLHLLSMLLLTAGVVAYLRVQALRGVLSLSAPFVWANAALVTVWAATAFYHGQSPRDALEQGVLLVVFLALAALVHHGLSRSPDTLLDALRWSAVVCVGSLLTALVVSTTVNGVNAFGVIQQSIASGDPTALTRGLFRPAFEGFGLTGDQARSNLRHEIFGAVLLSALVSAAASSLRPPRSPGARLLQGISVAVAVLLVVTSLSRAVVVAACAWPVLGLWRVLRTGTLPARQAAVTAATAGAALVLAATGVLSVIWVRFAEDTASYEARQGLLEGAFEFLAAHPFTGGFDTVGESSHNLVIDTWLRAGIVAAVAAVVVVGWMVALLVRTTLRLPHEPLWVIPITAALALPLVRAFTVGGGALPPVQWVCLAFVVGFLAWHTDQRANATGTPAEAAVGATRTMS